MIKQLTLLLALLLALHAAAAATESMRLSVADEDDDEPRSMRRLREDGFLFRPELSDIHEHKTHSFRSFRERLARSFWPTADNIHQHEHTSHDGEEETHPFNDNKENEHAWKMMSTQLRYGQRRVLHAVLDVKRVETTEKYLEALKHIQAIAKPLRKELDKVRELMVRKKHLVDEHLRDQLRKDINDTERIVELALRQAKEAESAISNHQREAASSSSDRCLFGCFPKRLK